MPLAQCNFRLSKRNGFSYQKLGDRGNCSRQYDVKSMNAFAQKVLEQPQPSVTNRHIHFVDFNDPRLHIEDHCNGTRLNPTYINSLRDPLGNISSKRYSIWVYE